MIAGAPRHGQPEHGPVLAIEADRLTVDGTPRFLLFVSYFDGLRAPARERDADMKWLRESGVSGVRIFANWHHWCSSANVTDGVIGPRGMVNRSRLDVLKQFLSAASARRLLVDLSFDREIGTVPITMHQYNAAITEVASQLRSFQNVVFDIQNEYQLHSFSDADVAAAFEAVRKGDASRLVTASRVDDAKAAGVAASATGMDVVAFHDPRTKGTWFTGTRIRAHVRDIRSGLGRERKPIYFQEPESFDRGPACQSKSFDAELDHATQAVEAARSAGAAAWTFHTRAGFDLSRSSLVEQLTAAERKAIRDLAKP